MEGLKKYGLKIHVPVRALRSLVGNLKERYRRERRSIRIYRWFSCARITRKKDSLPHTENEFQEEPKQKKKKDDDGTEDSVEASSTPTSSELEDHPPTPIAAVPELSLHELMENTDNFGLRSMVGEGSHARVYYAVLNGKEIAIKKLDMPQKHESNSGFMSQLSFASRLKHRSFVQLLGYYVEGNLRLLAYEFAAMGSLQDILHGGMICIEFGFMATPRLGDKNKVKQCVDPRLKGLYPPAAAAQFAQVAAECVEYEADHRPDMSSVVKKLRKIAVQLSLP
ncbi:hypothetical protein C4D60_Mb02t21650 [Musa balbisiana]|uniref:Protein kinase domain-containing protein n=1 Tax=Musa balbisiana TaxID=52838 RepID=A0A4V4H2V1_MUSBA|nr:hypothetical protein C4D60_Mb02t21650 [Musa balbisiana]